MRLAALPIRVRLVAGFALSMVVVLIGAGAFVFWRVQYALDRRLDEDLRVQTTELRRAADGRSPRRAIAALGARGRDAQLLDPDGRVLASGPGLLGRPVLFTAVQTKQAAGAALRTERGNLFSVRGRHLRVLALPVDGGSEARVAATAVRLDQRDEALRELLAQLAIANLVALALASLVGYRLTRAALDPVERYRMQAEQITQGATGVRLDMPAGRQDELSRLGATLNAMIAAQERATERQRQFVDDASHELRTPLSAMVAEVDLALRKPRSREELYATLERVGADTARLVTLAEALLTLGALNSTIPQAVDVDAEPLLETVARRARSQLDPRSGRRVQIVVPSGSTVHGDAALLERALGNAVDNAVRYGAGHVTLAVAQLEAQAPPGRICTVHDEGPGLPADFLRHAAERFRQAESSRSGPGAGLGLSLVDAIATAHRGQLRICSNGVHHRQPTADTGLAAATCRHPDRGTTVSLLLPGGAPGNGRGP